MRKLDQLAAFLQVKSHNWKFFRSYIIDKNCNLHKVQKDKPRSKCICNSVKTDVFLRSHNPKNLNQALPLRVPPMLPVTHPHLMFSIVGISCYDTLWYHDTPRGVTSAQFTDTPIWCHHNTRSLYSACVEFVECFMITFWHTDWIKAP